MTIPARNRVRRLYCLECGDASLTMLPSKFFVENHAKKHNLPEGKVNDSFLVVERPVTDRTILLDDNLATMFTKSWLEWGGAVDKASKYEERAKKAKGTIVVVK